MKTRSAAKKRFRVRGNGGVFRAQAYKHHLMVHKTREQANRLGSQQRVHASDHRSVTRMLGMSALQK